MNRKFRALIITLCILSSAVTARAQVMLGNTGGLNIPTAEMDPSGTFRGGLNFLGEGLITPVKHPFDHRWEFNYDTYVYYLDFTMFDWMEVSIRETLLENFKNESYKLREQDRSVSIKIRPVKEGKYCPAIAIGTNDPTSITGKHPYASAWLVMTKHLHSSATAGTWSCTLGYMTSWEDSYMYEGPVANLCYAPDWWKNSQFMVEYDTQGINYGLQGMIGKHFGFYVFGREDKAFSAGLRYQTTIKYRKQ